MAMTRTAHCGTGPEDPVHASGANRPVCPVPVRRPTSGFLSQGVGAEHRYRFVPAPRTSEDRCPEHGGPWHESRAGTRTPERWGVRRHGLRGPYGPLHHSISAKPADMPPPKPAMRIRSPGWKAPARAAVSMVIGMEAAPVLP